MKGDKTPAARIPRLGLAPKLALVLTVAILPLGLISLYQTSSVIAERRAVSEAALLEQTQLASARAQELVRSAISAAEALASAAIVLDEDSTTCDTVFTETVRRTPDFVFAGFVNAERAVICASNGDHRDLSDIGGLSTEFESRSPELSVLPQSFFGNSATLSITTPVISEGEYLGKIWIAIPVDIANAALKTGIGQVELALFDSGGEVLATEHFGDDRRNLLPRDLSLADLARGGRQSFPGTNRSDQPRDYAVVPIVQGRVFALGSWKPQANSGLFMGAEETIAIFFPVVMWIVALLVAYIGIHRLVIRHVRRLRHWMYLYSAGHGGLNNARLDNAPPEIEVVAQAFLSMTHRIARHEDRRREDVDQISTLFREVHHRVKNNLQLISSMMNMQIRNASGNETKRVLRRVQDRVMALASIHRHLYMSRKLAQIEADSLLEDIIRQMIVVGPGKDGKERIEFATAFDRITIDPEQSVPLTLLATEAAMNAVKYCGPDEDGRTWIDVALKRTGETEITLSVVNSLALDAEGKPIPPSDADYDSTGLGSKLIESFASQLGGTLEVEQRADRFELHVTFTPMEVDAEEKSRFDEDVYFSRENTGAGL